MNVLVYMEEKEGVAVPASLEALGAAQTLGTVKAAAIGSAKAAQAAADYGIPAILAKTGDASADAQVAALEAIVKEEKPDVVLFAATQLGKDLAPRLAQRFEAGCVTDATWVENSEQGLVFTRPAYGGTVLERLKVESALAVATVRGGSYSKPQPAQTALITEKEIVPAPETLRAQVKEVVHEITEAVDLEGADVIVAGGRGMGDAEHFKLVEELAALLGGVVGASRPAIEEGWISRTHQIGQSGKIVAPKLYIACGISGAMQHISGAMGAKYIVAINKDEAASIFNVADVGIVGDVREILPMLIEAIREQKQS